MPTAAELNQRVNDTAYDIIEGSPEELRLPVRDWDVVRALVREGVRRGMEMYMEMEKTDAEH